MAEVTLTDVVKRYGKSEVVHRINLEISDLEFVVFVGPSGCGKSTTLRMIAGLETVSEGDIRIGGRRVNDVAPKDRDVAMVFQNYALYPHMNVYNNMAFGLKLRKLPPSEIRRRVGEAAEVLGLSEFLKRKPFELSGGQRQRVAMGRAIVRNPSVFLFDEPLSNLDAKLRNQMRAEIKRLHKRVGTTIIYVTHDQVEAMTLADRIVVMQAGVIEQAGNPLDLYRKPVNTFVAGFIGSPPMNLIPGRIVFSNNSRMFQGEGGFQAPIPPKERTPLFSDPSPSIAAVMGLRPEDITLDAGDIRFSSVWKTQALIEFVEPLGSETYLHADVSGVKLMGKADGSRRVSPGDIVPIALNLGHLHLFDAEKRISIY